jgi:phage/plasmid-like protein (TIGR03299 family)
VIYSVKSCVIVIFCSQEQRRTKEDKVLTTLNGVGHDASQYSSVEDALEQTGLNWGVELRNTYYETANGEMAKIPKGFVVVRNDTDAVLGRVGSDYMPLRNSLALASADRLIETGEATLDSVFELKGGKRVGASLALNDTISIAGEDPMKFYITLFTSHDGSQATMATVTPIRMWCSNQSAVIIKTARHAWAVRHLSTIKEQLLEVRHELEYVTAYEKEFERIGTELALRKMSENELKMIADAALEFVKNDDNRAKSVGAILETWKTSSLIGDDYRDTAWGGFNAITEWVDHRRNYRSAEARYHVITNGFGARVRNNAFAALQAV